MQEKSEVPMQENRLFERINAPMQISYEVVENAPAKTAESKDISGGGIRLSLNEKLKEGSALKLMIGIPGAANKTTVAYGVVVWTRKIEIMGPGKASGYYETGIQFTKADPLILGQIFKYFQKKT
jgi:c-di-GMP-binding flagellar brake protein YcgR